ncbi:hypothetical protein [Halorubrum sp. Atlit-26R]|uniref:hypothetical protein n=1 Tax=Halorubrum sp. Atlit-26R TaxID=2282128 RepID=UPI000EF234B2|nr:hypothetical protein [Halorubrum sp. Atlit-26R]RLM62616.1 hypothetical protein DVK07_18205 [Halorubrum sp. Atlit-26R]
MESDDDYPAGCQTDGCHREAKWFLSAYNPHDIDNPYERALCEPCYNVYKWSTKISPADTSSTPINRGGE